MNVVQGFITEFPDVLAPIFMRFVKVADITFVDRNPVNSKVLCLVHCWVIISVHMFILYFRIYWKIKDFMIWYSKKKRTNTWNCTMLYSRAINFIMSFRIIMLVSRHYWQTLAVT